MALASAVDFSGEYLHTGGVSGVAWGQVSQHTRHTSFLGIARCPPCSVEGADNLTLLQGHDVSCRHIYSRVAPNKLASLSTDAVAELYLFWDGDAALHGASNGYGVCNQGARQTRLPPQSC